MIYKGFTYFKDNNGIWKVAINDTEFIVALDDTKEIGRKIIIEEKNNENTCKEFIDYICR